MIYITWSKHDTQMKVTGDHMDPWFPRVSCVVRNELNGWRPNPRKEPKLEVVHAITQNNHETNIPVMPRDFPAGKWEITWIESRTNPYQRPFFLATNAWQWLDVWELGNDGGYWRNTGDKIKDFMYGLHYSSSNTTLGCIKMHIMDDLMLLVDFVNEELKYGRNPVLEVVE